MVHTLIGVRYGIQGWNGGTVFGVQHIWSGADYRLCGGCGPHAHLSGVRGRRRSCMGLQTSCTVRILGCSTLGRLAPSATFLPLLLLSPNPVFSWGKRHARTHWRACKYLSPNLPLSAIYVFTLIRVALIPERVQSTKIFEFRLINPPAPAVLYHTTISAVTSVS